MSTPFEPQPCGCGIVGPIDVNIAEPLDVNVVTITEPVDVNVVNTVSVAEPVDVNVLGTVTVAEPVDVNVLGTVTVAEPVDVNVLGTVTAATAGSTVASATLTTATTGNGTTVDFANAKSNVSLFIQVNGTVTAGVVDLQASQDGVNWVRVMFSSALATGVNQYLSVSGGAFRWYRGVVSDTVTGGGSVTATLMFA